MRTDDHKCPTCGGVRWELKFSKHCKDIKLLKCNKEGCGYSLLLLPSTFWERKVMDE